MNSPAPTFTEIEITRTEDSSRSGNCAPPGSQPIVLRLHDETVIEIPAGIARDQLVTLMVAVRRAWE